MKIYKRINTSIDLLKEKTINFFLLKENILLLCIFILGIIFRVYNFQERIILGDEVIRDAIVGLEGARMFQFPLTGPFSSIGPFTFGPWYWYQLIIVSLIIKSPFVAWMYLVAQSIVYMIFMYILGRMLISKWFGILLALLTSVSPVFLLSSYHLTNPNMIHFFAVLSLLLFTYIIRGNHSRWWTFALGITIGIGINIHYQMQGFMIIPIFLLYFKRRQLTHFLICMIGVGVTCIPMMLFDMNNHWFTVRNMTYYYLYGKNAIYIPNRWLFYVRDFWFSFWANVFGLPNILGGILMILSGVTAAVIVVKRKINKELLSLLLIFAFEYILLRYYWGERTFGYVNFLVPFVLILTALLFYWVTRINKYIGITCIIFLIGWMIYKDIPYIQQDKGTQEMYRITNIIENAYPNEKFSLYSCSNNRMPYEYSIMYILLSRNKLSNSGRKLGFWYNYCDFPRPKEYDSSKYTISSDMVFKMYPQIKTTGIMDMSSASEAGIFAKKWTHITPQTIYNSNVRWWFLEQP